MKGFTLGLIVFCGCTGDNPNFVAADDLAAGVDALVPDDLSAGGDAGLDLAVEPKDASSEPAIDLAGVGCVVGGVHYASGTISPGDLCQRCDPAQSTTQFTMRDDGASCGGSKVCVAGNCVVACHIAGQYYVTDYVNPANACQRCQPSQSATQWSSLPDNSSCPGGVCFQGACADGCVINGGAYAAGAVNPANACQSCQPGVNPSGWTITNGASCGAGMICKGATCLSGCYINGIAYNAGTPRTNTTPCADTCDPAQSTTAWTPRPGATGCKFTTNQITFHEGVCYLGACHDGCYIAGMYWDDGSLQPGNACQQCITPSFLFNQAEPAPSLAWTALDGSACGANMKCLAGTCQ